VRDRAPGPTGRRVEYPRCGRAAERSRRSGDGSLQTIPFAAEGVTHRPGDRWRGPSLRDSSARTVPGRMPRPRSRKCSRSRADRPTSPPR